MLFIPFHLKLLFGTCFIFLAFWTYGTVHFCRDPGSLLFFNPSRAYERKYSLFREKEVLEFRKQATGNIHKRNVESHRERKSDPQTCAVVVSVDRKIAESDVHPLEITLFSAVAGLTSAERQSLHLHVYLAHTNPSSHSLWDSPLLNVSNKIIDGLSTPFSTDPGSETLLKLQYFEKQRLLNAKTALDLSYALESCLNAVPNAKFIALIEDDILFAEGWYAQALAGLAQIEGTKDGREKMWMDLRLFRPESNIGWSDRHLLGNHAPLIIFIIDAMVLAAIYGIRFYRGRLGRLFYRKVARVAQLSNASLLVLCVITVPTAVITFFATGKSSLSMLFERPGAHVQNWGCCTQTVFFPTRNVPYLIHSLRGHVNETTPDEIVGQHAKMIGLKRYVLNPVLVQHRGARSSIITPKRNGQAAKGLLWSAAFENLDAQELKKKHLQLAGKAFGDSHAILDLLEL